jgi:hypothetical protein
MLQFQNARNKNKNDLSSVEKHKNIKQQKFYILVKNQRKRTQLVKERTIIKMIKQMMFSQAQVSFSAVAKYCSLFLFVFLSITVRSTT